MMGPTQVVIVTVLFSKFLICFALESTSYSSSHAESLNTKTHLMKRSILTFPPQSIFQITMGIALAGEFKRNNAAIVLGMQQNANLPNDSLPLFFPPQVVTARKSSVYKHLVYLFGKYKYNGPECLKKMICQASKNPFIGGLLEEIISFVLSPTKLRSIAKGVTENQIEEDEVQLLLKSEEMGKKGENCSFEFPDCSQTPLEAISNFFNL